MLSLLRTCVLLACFFFVTNVPAQTAETSKPSHWGLHGMLIFGGKEALYASHLPMFHAPHDRQLIFRFHLSDSRTDQLLRDELATSSALWTLEPEQFDLNRMQATHPHRLQQFSGKFFQGHFERGGTERYADQTIVIDEIVIFHELAPKKRHHSEGKYLLIGRNTEQFLMKKIDRHPDFDILVKLKPKTAFVQKITRTQLTLPTGNLSRPHPNHFSRAISKQLGKDWEFGSVIYFETEDLK